MERTTSYGDTAAAAFPEMIPGELVELEAPSVWPLFWHLAVIAFGGAFLGTLAALLVVGLLG